MDAGKVLQDAFKSELGDRLSDAEMAQLRTEVDGYVNVNDDVTSAKAVAGSQDLFKNMAIRAGIASASGDRTTMHDEYARIAYTAQYTQRGLIAILELQQKVLEELANSDDPDAPNKMNALLALMELTRKELKKWEDMEALMWAALTDSPVSPEVAKRLRAAGYGWLVDAVMKSFADKNLPPEILKRIVGEMVSAGMGDVSYVVESKLIKVNYHDAQQELEKIKALLKALRERQLGMTAAAVAMRTTGRPTPDISTKDWLQVAGSRVPDGVIDKTKTDGAGGFTVGSATSAISAGSAYSAATSSK
jgi:hypothetical protein